MNKLRSLLIVLIVAVFLFTGQVQAASLQNTAPLADAGPDQTVGMNTLVTLDGSASSDPENDLPLTYAWEQTGGTPVVLTGADTVSPTFTAPNTVDTLTFSLLVTDSLGLPAAAPDTVTFTVDYNYVYLPLIMGPPPPAAFNKSSPSNGAINQSLTPKLSWGATSPVTKYEYCYDTTNDGACSSWISNGTSTSVTLPELLPTTTYYWQVRAWNNNAGPTYANGSANAFWLFTTSASDPILNGGFELGRGIWEEYSELGYYSIYNVSYGTPISPHSGSWLAWMADELYETSAIAQTITIPVGRSILHYWFASNSNDICENDLFGILLDDTVVYAEYLCYVTDTNDVWVHRTLDLSAYAGSTKKIWFVVTTNGTYNSRVFLDDISFEISSSLSSSEIQSNPILPDVSEEILKKFNNWRNYLQVGESGNPLMNK